MMRHPASELYSLAIAASRRMSYPPRSAMAPHKSATASIANVFAAMVPIFCAIASCWPILRPHCTRSFAHGYGADGQREPSRVEGDQGQLQALALAPQHVFLGDADVGEPDHPVVH